jgi:hypothetical protein
MKLSVERALPSKKLGRDVEFEPSPMKWFGRLAFAKSVFAVSSTAGSDDVLTTGV